MKKGVIQYVFPLSIVFASEDDTHSRVVFQIDGTGRNPPTMISGKKMSKIKLGNLPDLKYDSSFQPETIDKQEWPHARAVEEPTLNPFIDDHGNFLTIRHQEPVPILPDSRAVNGDENPQVDADEAAWIFASSLNATDSNTSPVEQEEEEEDESHEYEEEELEHHLHEDDVDHEDDDADHHEVEEDDHPVPSDMDDWLDEDAPGLMDGATVVYDSDSKNPNVVEFQTGHLWHPEPIQDEAAVVTAPTKNGGVEEPIPASGVVGKPIGARMVEDTVFVEETHHFGWDGFFDFLRA